MERDGGHRGEILRLPPESLDCLRYMYHVEFQEKFLGKTKDTVTYFDLDKAAFRIRSTNFKITELLL